MSLTWFALPIAPNEDFDGAPLLRTEFGLEAGHGSVVRATLHATAHGIFEALSQRRARVRRCPQPRVEQLRMAPALSQLRRDVAHRNPGQSLVSPSGMGGSAGGLAGAAAAPSTATSLLPSRSWRSNSLTAVPDRCHR